MVIIKNLEAPEVVDSVNGLYTFSTSSEPKFSYLQYENFGSEYCFTRGEPMSGTDIKNIRREISITTGLKIPYENPIFQLLPIIYLY